MVISSQPRFQGIHVRKVENAICIGRDPLANNRRVFLTNDDDTPHLGKDGADRYNFETAQTVMKSLNRKETPADQVAQFDRQFAAIKSDLFAKSRELYPPYEKKTHSGSSQKKTGLALAALMLVSLLTGQWAFTESGAAS